MKPILFVISLFFCLDSYASFNGTWVGEGTYKAHRSEGNCPEVGMAFEESDFEFKIIYGSYDCGLLKAEYPSSVFEKRNGFLFYGEEKVGYFTDELIYLSYENGVFELVLEKYLDDQIYYLERWDDGKSFLTIKAKLLKR